MNELNLDLYLLSILTTKIYRQEPSIQQKNVLIVHVFM